MFEKQIKIPEPEEILQQIPMPDNLKAVKKQRDKLVSDVIKGENDHLILDGINILLLPQRFGLDGLP